LKLQRELRNRIIFNLTNNQVEVYKMFKKSQEYILNQILLTSLSKLYNTRDYGAGGPRFKSQCGQKFLVTKISWKLGLSEDALMEELQR